LVAYENKNESCLYLIGGFCGHELDDCFQYDIKENKWTQIESLPRKLSVFACSSVNDETYEGKLRLILHGGEVDPSTLGDKFKILFYFQIILIYYYHRS
jgi:hypothetical protein